MGTPGDPALLRVGDAEREAAAAALSEHFTAGRLSLQEFDARTSAAYAAKTRGDLDGLFADLPMLSRPAVVAQPVGLPVVRRRRVPVPVVVLLVVVVAPWIFFALHAPFLLIPFLWVVWARSHGHRHRGAPRR